MTELVRARRFKEKKIKCSLSDHLVSRMPVSVAFFYDTEIDAGLIVKHLERVLEDFPVFAGRLVNEEGQLFIDCNNQGVQVGTSESKESVHEALLKFPSQYFVEAIDVKKLSSPLLKIKINQFSDGTIIGYSWHHSVGDMASFMEFLSALSDSVKGNDYNPPLIVEDREHFLHQFVEKKSKQTSSSLKRLSWLDIFHFLKQAFLPKRGAFFYFSQEEVEALRKNLSAKAKLKLSKNDAICSYLLEILGKCRQDRDPYYHISIPMNFREKLFMPQNVLGNYIAMVSIKLKTPFKIETCAKTIHRSVKKYLQEEFDPLALSNFVKKNGGIKKISLVILKEFLPQYKNLIVTNWSNFDVYAIDFGIAEPYLFLPIGRSRLPWMSCILKGFNNRGFIVGLVLPSKIAKTLLKEENLQKIHQFRKGLSEEEEIQLQQNPWCH